MYCASKLLIFPLFSSDLLHTSLKAGLHEVGVDNSTHNSKIFYFVCAKYWHCLDFMTLDVRSAQILLCFSFLLRSSLLLSYG